MTDKDLTWEIIKSEYIGHTLFDRYCKLNSCCENCNPKVRYWCKVKVKIEKYQEKIITKILDKRNSGRE